MFATVEYASTTTQAMLPDDFVHHSKRRRESKPKGLWRARLDSHVRLDRRLSASPSNHDHGSCSDHSSVKRSKLNYHSDSSDEDDSYLFASTRHQTPLLPTPPPERESRWDTFSRLMDTTTTASRGPHTNTRSTCDFDDWEDLKELFTKAAEQYECGEALEALPLLRGVVHECHRFLICYPDPSILFSTHPRPTQPQPHSIYPSTAGATPDVLTPQDEHVHSWDCCSKKPIQPRKKCTCVELPTAFHAILGTALFLFGNLIAQEPSLALAGEPDVPIPYWFAALDVFETGENLPSRTSGYGCEAPEDWRMAIVWGRTLVCIADETLTRSAQDHGTANFFDQEPKWPRESPFSTIAARRPPVTRRMSMSSASAHELMILAMDQFSRGIFHMPHQQTDGSFSRAKELYTLASEVLLLAEKMDVATERQYWASWADSVFNQMKMEADMDQWRGPITRARGKCWLTVGSARVEELEAALEAGDIGVLQSRDAADARKGLTKAIEFFERAKGSASMNNNSGLDDADWRELSPLLTEALLTLANLTQNEEAREALYLKAEAEGGNLMDCD